MANSENNPIAIFAQTNFRNQKQIFGIKKLDRRQHMYIIGQTGTGKTTLLETMIRQDMEKGEGLAVIDPHGDFVDRLFQSVPEHREGDVVYLDATNPNCPYGFNPFESVPEHRRALAASGILEAFQKIWSTTWGPRLEHILRNTLLTLFEQPSATLADVSLLFNDELFRRRAVYKVSNPQVKKFWQDEFEKFPIRYRTESLAPIQNKIGAFMSDPVIHRVMTAKNNNLDIRKSMDEGKIILVNLAKGRIGTDNSALLGAMIVSHIGLAAISRAEVPEHERRDFYLYLDEFQNFTTLSMANMLSELRKYHLCMIMAHQYLSQINQEVRDAVFGNAGTFISFRIGLRDAELIEKEFYPKFSREDIINLPNYNIYLKLMIDGEISKPFSAKTIITD